jgi:1-acyl-sn-glycerol-3-phosphate acyltransferase
MIRRSVRRRFHSVYWIPPSFELRPPVIFVPNHHGWFDGYLMYHVVTQLGIPTLDWIQEYDSFPLFGKIGGMPYPLQNPRVRAATVKRTIRMMRDGKWSLLLFAEAELHYPPTLLEFGKALETVADKVTDAQVVPVAIKYEMAMHERPEAFISMGEPLVQGGGLSQRTRQRVQELLCELESAIRVRRDGFDLLAGGTPDVNERWSMARFSRK